jgi:hypothetical protein
MVAFRRDTLLSLYDCPQALQAMIPHLMRSLLSHCTKRGSSSFEEEPLNVQCDSPQYDRV